LSLVFVVYTLVWSPSSTDCSLARLSWSEGSLKMTTYESVLTIDFGEVGYTKVRYRGLAKNTAQLYTLFMLSNLWMVRKRCPGGLAA